MLAGTMQQPSDVHPSAEAVLGSQDHEVQHMFGVSTFLMLVPATYTGRIMHAEVTVYPMPAQCGQGLVAMQQA